jgi:uncharacterized protein YyaL (SSP411 family)
MGGAIPAEEPRDSTCVDQSVPLRNRASESLSPFVRSFANSPVAWQLLDNATIERAKKEHKLIFLHIGYKACHRELTDCASPKLPQLRSSLTSLDCRLMAVESFSTPECASILSESYIPVVIDRDERPDLDTIYMNYVQAVSNSGGWPLNLFLTPNLEPVFGGTYWPAPTSTRRTTGENEEEVLDFLSIVKRVCNIWREQEARCRKEATEVVGQLREFAAEGTLGTRSLAPTQSILPSAATAAATPAASMTQTDRKTDAPSSELDLDQLEEAYTSIAGTFDPVYAGFGLAPKFVTPPKLNFLLRLSQFPGPVQDVVGETECAHARSMVFDTLRQISNGALHDHIGETGFFRFSITPDWTIPNFEKLVVDNALLLSLYREAWKQQGGKEESEFFDVVIELAEYLSSPPVALPCGAFASSEAADAYYKKGDTDMREGAYYVWTRREFDSAVGSVDKQASQVAAAYFGVLEDGNVDEYHDPNDDFINQNILAVRPSVEELAQHFSITVQQIEEHIKSAKAALKAKRDQDRVRPELDDKVITGWNGIVISALARTSAALKELRPEQSDKYAESAKKAAAFIREQLWDADAKKLYRIWREERGTEAFADDYAYLILGLLDLFGIAGDESHLEFADILQSRLHLDHYTRTPEGAC